MSQSPGARCAVAAARCQGLVLGLGIDCIGIGSSPRVPVCSLHPPWFRPFSLAQSVPATTHGSAATMISPRSYAYARHPSPSSSPSSSTHMSPNSSPSTSPQPSTSLFRQYILHTHQRRHRQRSPSPSSASPHSSPIAIAPRSSGDSSRQPVTPKHDRRESLSSPFTASISPIRSTASTSPSSASTPTVSFLDDTMGKRKERLEASLMGLAASRSPPTSTTTTAAATAYTRPTTPTSPVQIPKSGNRQTAHSQKRSSTQRRRSKQAPTSDDLPPSLASLLASTDIPRQRSVRRKRRSDMPLTVDDIIAGHHISEKEISWTLSRGPMTVLLSPPEELIDDDISGSDCNVGSALSTRTMSVDSIPSLGESFATDGISSVETPGSPSSSFRGRRMSPMRRSLEPILSPPGEDLEHPLASPLEKDELTLDPLPESIEEEDEPTSHLLEQFKPLKYAFKSNLTASLRALRSAAKSFSTINFSSIPSDDFLTRSLLTIDTKVPYADERRPPVTEDMPSAEVRRYLNPTTTSRAETPLATVPPAGTFSASIQMQTYKVHRSKLNPGRNSFPRSSPQSAQQQLPPPPPQSPSSPTSSPLMRQREMRENPDFIRIAVMEMAMRKRGKLDDQRPGRARWTLPPRQMASGTYKIGPNGVPARWVSHQPGASDTS